MAMHGGSIPQSTLQSISLPDYVRKKALNPRKIECTCAGMMGKSPDVQFGIQDLCQESGVKYMRLCVDIFSFQDVRWKWF